MRRFAILICFLVFTSAISQEKRPKLVVGIVVDQMRYDYLTRFKERYGDDGFNKLIRDGFLLDNANFDYIPTYTAVGHTSVYTGTTPKNHGIVGNNWYDKYEKKEIYCVDDSRYQSIGVSSKSGQKSPYRMQTTTITDQLKLAQNLKGKTIGIAIKDRSSILPAGHTADAAYWYEGRNENKWISSSFYLQKLPKWVNDFNANNKANQYLSKPWKTLHNINSYELSISDDNEYEGTFHDEKRPVFPHNLPKLRKENGNFEIIKSTPFGNTLTFDFAKAAIEGEELGKSKWTDFLAVSFSSTDYVGHRYGPDAVEIEDTYLRFDKDLADFISFLDTKVGKGKYTIFLTADHGVVQVPAYLQSLRIPAHYFDGKAFMQWIKTLCKERFGNENIIENISNYQIFLNKEELVKLKLSTKEVADYLVEQSINYKGIYKAVTAHTLQTTQFTDGVLHKIQEGYNQKFSGDVILIPNPATLSSGSKKGTSHGSGYSYDTHVPIIFYGWGIEKGSSSKRYYIKDIAPTLAKLLSVEFPNGTTGKVISEVLKN